MAIFEVRLRAGETGNWAALRQRASIAGDPRKIRAGDNQVKLPAMVALRGVQKLTLPKMIRLSPKLGIMRTEVTVGLFNQVMKGYEITGQGADNLKALLASDKGAKTVLTFVSLLDAREFAKRLSEQTGRKFRVQTEAEWLKAQDNLSGNNWTWTETSYSRIGRTSVLRNLNGEPSKGSSAENRFYNSAVRLVEDL